MIRTVVIGLGRIGWMLEKDNYRYHPCTHTGTLLSLSKRFKIVAGCDLSEERRVKFKRYIRSKMAENVELYSDVDQLIRAIFEKKVIIDFAVIATGPESHPDIFKKLILAGVKRFLIEKPVALNSNVAMKMLRSKIPFSVSTS
ncbi:MAG: Gfo/Idh/MocA family oxidoreductase [Leptonema sp. (in: Bacteria)]|nr:Gfo/Idh/MocA family oxidoreductase [Leptonema sp. (in: bacteria)]